jgi:excisionase family DNA binding protein
MKEYLTIGEAAQRLNLQVDTVRRLERAGTLKAERTDGKHRRFRAEVIERYARRREAAPARRYAQVAPEKRVRRPDPAPSRPGREPIEADSFPEMAEWQSFDDSEPLLPVDDELPVTPRSVNPQVVSPSRSRDEEASRLHTIKNLGLQAIPFAVPPAWRGRVVADLERFVTRTQFPTYLTLFDSGNLVRARVEEVLEPYHADMARRTQELADKTAAESRLNALKAHGRRYVVSETSEWEWSEACEARRDVETALNAEVQAGWSELDVEDLADDILDDFEDDEEEEEDEEDEERDSGDGN